MIQFAASLDFGASVVGHLGQKPPMEGLHVRHWPCLALGVRSQRRSGERSAWKVRSVGLRWGKFELKMRRVRGVEDVAPGGLRLAVVLCGRLIRGPDSTRSR